MKIDKKNVAHWVLLAQQALFTFVVIIIRPFHRKPKTPHIVLYGHQFSGNLKALYEQWALTHETQAVFYFLTLNPKLARQLEKNRISVLRCNRLTDMLKLTQASAVITDHGLHMMTPLIRFTDIRFIDVWHGIPFKGFTPEDFKLQHRYDEVWVSSPLLKEIYGTKFGFSPEIVRDMGYARTDKLFRQDKPSLSVKKALAIAHDTKVVLYAPTWQQDDEGRELFPFDLTHEAFIGQLSKTCREHGAALVIRSHLNAKISRQQFANVYYASMKQFPDSESLLLESDILICDWSSIAFDYLALNRPTIFLDVTAPFKNGFSLGPEYRFGEIIADLHSLNHSLRNALGSPSRYFQSHREKHNTVCQDVYGKSQSGDKTKLQLDHLINSIISI